MTAEIRILYRGRVGNLNLLRGLYVALWRLNLLNRWYMVRDGIVEVGTEYDMDKEHNESK